jgi:hypothetical protein
VKEASLAAALASDTNEGIALIDELKGKGIILPSIGAHDQIARYTFIDTICTLYASRNPEITDSLHFWRVFRIALGRMIDNERDNLLTLEKSGVRDHSWNKKGQLSRYK